MIFLGVALGAIAGLVLGGVYYSALPVSPAPGHSAPTRAAGLQAVVELARSAFVSALLAGLMSAAGFSGALTGGLLGLALWVLPVVLLVGSVFHEGTPIRTAALHAGDWLLKLLVVGALVGSFV
ncbi:MAG: DUF1761 family protein [Ornithinimicrobium sp.]